MPQSAISDDIIMYPPSVLAIPIVTPPATATVNSDAWRMELSQLGAGVMFSASATFLETDDIRYIFQTSNDAVTWRHVSDLDYMEFPQWNTDKKVIYNPVAPFAQTASFVGTSQVTAGVLTHWSLDEKHKYWRVQISITENDAAFDLTVVPVVMSDQIPAWQWAPADLLPSDGKP
jgi:hypothetical protein